MRGRKPRSLRIVADDVPILHQISRSRSLPWYQVQRAQNPRRGCRGRADPSTIRSDPVRSIDHLEGLSAVRVFGLTRSSGTSQSDRATSPDFPPCNGLRSSDWHAWNQSPRDCTSLIGRARIWPAKRSRMVSFPSSAIKQFETFFAMSTFSRIVLGIRRRSNRRSFQGACRKILWCYANAERLAERGFWVVCADEKPGFQVLERHPIRHSVPGPIRTAQV